MSIIFSFLVVVNKWENDLSSFMASPSMSVSPLKMHWFNLVSNGDPHRILCSMGSERILTLLYRCTYVYSISSSIGYAMICFATYSYSSSSSSIGVWSQHLYLLLSQSIMIARHRL